MSVLQSTPVGYVVAAAEPAEIAMPAVRDLVPQSMDLPGESIDDGLQVKELSPGEDSVPVEGVPQAAAPEPKVTFSTPPSTLMDFLMVVVPISALCILDGFR